MNKLTIPERKIEVDYPSEWDEINTACAEKIGAIMYSAFMLKTDYDLARKMAVDVFINRVNSAKKPAYNEESANYWANELLLAESVNFLFNKTVNRDGTESIEINPKFCTNPIPIVKVGWRKFKGPRDLLSDLTIWQFKEASWRVGKYAQTKNQQYLDGAFSVLYLKTDERDPEKGERRRQRIVGKVSLGIKFMTYLFFLGCMNWIREESIEVDGQEICFGCLFPSAKQSTKEKEGVVDDKTGMAGILFQMAESGVFGNMEQTSRVNMWDVFLRLYQIHQQIKGQKQ